MELAGKEERVINFLTDTTFIIIITVIIFGLVALILNTVTITDRPTLILILTIVYFTYYISFELKIGQTPGKIITYTCVVKKDNTKIKFLDAFLRTLVRIFGLDVHSYLFGTELGMHDILTNTRVIKDLEKESPSYNKEHSAFVR